VPVLRWTRRGARLCVSEHADLAEAAAAQALAATGPYATLIGAELVGEGEPQPIPVADVRYHQARAARWHVVVRHPDGGRAVHSVHPDESAAQAEVARLALLVGARRVKAELAGA
jgi:hypothetical protein